MDVVGRILRVAHLANGRVQRALRTEGIDSSGADVLATLRRCAGGAAQKTCCANLEEDISG
jgi:hypothetical protein